MTGRKLDSTQSEPPRRFLITGAKGFIGAWIVKDLVERGERPYVIDIDTGSARLAALLTPEQLASVPFIQGDVTRFADVESAIVEHGITHVLHLAGIQVPGDVDLQYVRDTSRIFIRCAEAAIAGARVYTPRGSVVRVQEFLATLEQIPPQAHTLIKAEGEPLPIAADLDDSALQHDLGCVPRTSLEEGIRETAATFEHLRRAGRLDTQDLET